MSPTSLTRRSLLGAAAAAVAGSAEADAAAKRWAARPPAGFTRLSIPGKVVRATRPDSRQANGAYPKPEAAQALLQAAMTGRVFFYKGNNFSSPPYKDARQCSENIT